MDRNRVISNVCPPVGRSLSARRAWIEMVSYQYLSQDFWVALRKESVDRNLPVVGFLITLGGSLSARRAWIEIAWVQEFPKLHQGRSPQGERG